MHSFRSLYSHKTTSKPRDNNWRELAERRIREYAKNKNHSLTETRLGEYRDAFGLLDRDDDGSVSALEFGSLLDALGMDSSIAEVKVTC